MLVAACGDDHGPASTAAVRAALSPVQPADRPGLAWTGVLALTFLNDARSMAESVRAAVPSSDDPLTADACVLWAAAIRAAVCTGSLDGPLAGLSLIPDSRRGDWASWIAGASSSSPSVALLRAAWSAIESVPVVMDSPADGVFACGHLEAALVAAAPAGGAVAATAGALLGARWGASAVPFNRLRTLRPADPPGPGADPADPPGPKGSDGTSSPLGGQRCHIAALGAAGLVRLGARVAGGGRDDARGWPSLARRQLYPRRVDPAVPHPCDPGVLLGGLGAREADPAAVVSLCQIGHADFENIPVGDHLEFWLVDHPGDNNQPHYVIDQAARTVAALRAEGKRVFLHCHAGQSRTPSVAARYACLTAGVDPGTAFAQVAAATGRSVDLVNPELRAAVYELAGEELDPD